MNANLKMNKQKKKHNVSDCSLLYLYVAKYKF